jgi:hypothetical protein
MKRNKRPAHKKADSEYKNRQGKIPGDLFFAAEAANSKFLQSSEFFLPVSFFAIQTALHIFFYFL